MTFELLTNDCVPFKALPTLQFFEPGSSPPLRHGFPRILATLSEEGNNNNNNNINNNNINDNNNNSDDPGSHYGRWSRVGCGNDNNGAKDDHHYSEHCGKDGYTSKSTSRHANQHQNWRQQQQQQQQPNLPPASRLDALRYAGSGEGGSRPEQQMRHANLKLASHTASSSSGTASSSSSNSTWPSSPDSSTDLMSGDANDYNRSSSSGNSSDECSNSLCLPMTTTLSRQQQALARVQERIVQGQGQLEHYHHLILGLEQERIEAIELWTGMKQERDTLGLEIEVLEQVLTSHSTSVAAGRHQSLFSNAVGYLWTVSTPSPLKRNAEMENVDNKAPAPCCSSDLQVSTPATAATTTAMAIATITGGHFPETNWTPDCHRGGDNGNGICVTSFILFEHVIFILGALTPHVSSMPRTSNCCGQANETESDSGGC
ncbi:hypothetical protein B0O80DRAFT_487476 [Mortierella sp. GBAus27b]|nr:hypothetical protein B0O80DRAFT_487476 [Mortierella sp. GBAus27b]